MKTAPKAALGFIFVTLLIDITGLGIIIPVLPSLIMELTGEGLSASSKYGGWLALSYALIQFVFAPLVGGLSDRYGRKPVLILSLFGFAVDYLFLALAPTIGWLFVGRIFAGFFGASITTCSAYIADVSPPEKRAQNFGIIGAAFGIGFILGPVIGGLLGQYGTRIPFYASAILAFANAMYGLFILPESLSKDKRRKFEWARANPLGNLKALKKYTVISGLAVAIFFLYVASHAIQSVWNFFSMYKFEWDEAMVGYSLGAAGLLSGIVQGVLIRFIIPKLGNKKSVYLGIAFYSIGLGLFAAATQGWMLFVFLIPYCFGGIAGPSLQGIMSNEIPDNQQGELQGGVTSLMSLSAIIGPPLMTGIFAFFTKPERGWEMPGAPMILASILCLVALVLAYRTLNKSVVDKPQPIKEKVI